MTRSMSNYPTHFAGAHERTRTADLVLTKDVLYHLSYVGTTNARTIRFL